MSKQEFLERLQNGLNAAQDRLDELQKLKITRSFQAGMLHVRDKCHRHHAAAGIHGSFLE